MNNKICYEIFHIEGSDANRDKIFLDNNNLLSRHFARLESKTIQMFDKNDINSFISNYPSFKINPNDINKLKYGEVGLWASNYALFKKFLDTDYEYLMVFEDDVVVYQNFNDLLNFYIKELPDDWGSFSLFQPDTPHKGGYEKLPRVYGTNSIYIWKSHQSWSTGGILYKKDSIRKIINYVESSGISLALDMFLFKSINDIPLPCGGNDLFKCYSLSRMSQRMTGLFESKSQIQTTEFVDIN